MFMCVHVHVHEESLGIENAAKSLALNCDR